MATAAALPNASQNISGRAPLFGAVPDIAVAAGVITVVMMMIIPMPTPLLDMFMALNLVLGLLILLIVLYTKRPVDFNIFPTVLLVVTIFNLALSVSSTRLILSQGAHFNGRMIRAFSSFVVGSGGKEGIVVGFVMFIVIIAVQVVVITKGSTRIAEVAARFALDSMQNKYLAIDTEFNSGAITEAEAAARRAAVRKELDFYGAMDGASKFISNNVKIGIFITVVDVLGGIIIGAAIHGEPLSQAVDVYLAFAIGDGLLNQFPALFVSTAVGIMVTRSVSDGTFAEDIGSQFTRQPAVYWVSAGVLLVLAFIPGFPWYVLAPLAAFLGFFAYRLAGNLRRAAFRAGAGGPDAEGAKKDAPEEEMAPVAPLDPLSLELGYGLIPLVDKDKGAELLERIQRLRRESALDMGLVIPKIRIVDNMRLEPNEYCFKIRGDEVGRGRLRMNHYLCINPGGIKTDIPGEKTRDPAFGMPAVWVEDERRAEAEHAGYTVVDPPSVIATHLQEIIKQNAASILDRETVRHILDALKTGYKAVVEEAEKALTLGEIQKILQGLLREQVSIRNMVTILEAVSDYAGTAKKALDNPAEYLVEKARQALGRFICLQYANDDKTLHALTLSRELEQSLIDSSVKTASGRVVALAPEMHARWIKALSRAVSLVKEKGWVPPVVLCSENARSLVKQASERELPELVALSVLEITQDVNVVGVGEIRLEE